MPSGPPELHAKWQSDFNACEYLWGKGYTMTNKWTWIVPKEHTPTPEELEAIDYLCLEWDYGGLVP